MPREIRSILLGRNFRINRSDRNYYAAAAADTVAGWRFEPVAINGHSVRVRKTTWVSTVGFKNTFQ